MIDERIGRPAQGLPNDLYQLVALGRLEGKMDLALNRLTDHIADDRAQFARLEELREQEAQARQKAGEDEQRSHRATFSANRVVLLCALVSWVPQLLVHALTLLGH